MIRKITSIVTLCLLVLYSVDSFPCTALYIPQSPHQVFATNIDWNFGGGIIYINKRDVQKTSAYVTPPQTPLQWTSKYMSITIDQTGLEFPWEGMNEQGVAITLAQLPSTRLAAINSQPEVNGSQFIQYLLDTSASTVDAIANSQSVQVTGPFAAEEHYIVC